MELAGYQLQEVIYAVGETVVAAACNAAGERVVLKYLDSQRPAPELVARWRHEFDVLRSIDSPWVIRAVRLEAVGRGAVLVLEDFSPTNLAQLIGRQLLDLEDRLTLATRLVRAVSDVHRHQLIHGDLAPKNVLVEATTLQLKLCDFGLSTRLDHEQRERHDVFLRGTLEYMSPEQTGRTNLEIDYRSDFYSLGVTLYELFSGRKPFQFDEPMALLHAQIASMPKPLHELDDTLPAALSAVVQKLLAKHPDDRYQSSFGLLHDLEHCLQRWQTQRRIEPFEPGARDVPERFCVAQKLYGREAESARLLAAFERVSLGRVELLLVSGYSGIGKTALVAELHRPVVARRGYFLRGKCDQYAGNQPYGVLQQAFELLLRQLLVEGSQRRHYWKARLTAALGEHAGVVHELLPDLALLIGAAPPLLPLPPAENEQRLHITFAKFVRALASRSHPLLIFLDDLQWADLPTLRLLEHLTHTSGECCALIVGAYRDNEVDGGHPLTLALQAIERGQGDLERIRLRPLRAGDVRQLVADTLHAAVDTVAELAELCAAKTQGNPFFLGQFLRSLQAQGDLYYQRERGAWAWDIEQIRRRGMTDNVVELMLQKLALLGPETRELLALAAHLGDSFEQSALMAVAQRDAAATMALLWPALQAGLLLPLNEDYKYSQSPEQLRAARYRFLHDRVQQAAHALTAETERRRVQLKVGRRLLAASQGSQLDERLYTILDALNAALELITDAGERARLLTLNLRGAVRAKASSAYAPAVQLLRVAHRLLAADSWQQRPQETLELYRHLAEAEYLAGHFEQAEVVYPEALAAAPDALARVTLLLVQIEQYHIQGRFEEAFPLARQALELLGQPFPADEEAAGACFASEFAATEQALAARSQAELLEQAELQDPAQLLAMKVHLGLSHSSYQVGRFGAFVLNATRMVQITLRHGQSDLACVAYVAYLTAMSVMQRPYPACYAMGRLAVRLAEQRSNSYFRLTTYQYFAPFYQHWGEPLAATLGYLEKGLDLGLTGVNPLSAGYCALLRSVNRFLLGTPLDALQLECEQGLAYLQASRQPNTEAMLRYGVLQPLLALRGLTPDLRRFDSHECRIDDYFGGDYQTPSVVLAFHHAAMLRHAYLFGDGEAWRASAEQRAMVGRCLPDSPSWVDASLYTALGLLQPGWAGAGSNPAAEAAAIGEQFAAWAQFNPANFRPSALLIAAEQARVAGESREAMELYAQAIDAAAESALVPLEALCNELYARFWLAQQQRQLASNFIREAYFHYRRWGAHGKCRQLEANWPQVAFRMVDLRPGGSQPASSFRQVSEQSGLLDLHALLKASQLLSQEIQLDSLLEKMLGVLLENAGAEFAAIVVDQDDELMVEAIGQFTAGHRLQSQRIGRRLADTRLDEAPLLPNALIEYVQLTRTTLVINQPQHDERFAQSRYLRIRKPKSVLCLPVLNQGRLVALIYLENTLLENAFTARHLQTLELLSGQAAISLVNAHLYENLERKVAERTEALRQMSMKDGLTGIANRRSLDERMTAEWRRGQRSALPLALLMVDIDHFKLYNDHYGHLEGDRCIRAVAQALQRVIHRSSDLVARYGGEEFAVLLPETDADAACRLAESCIAAVSALAIEHAVSPVVPTVSLSIGICSLVADAQHGPEHLVERADQALYQAKHGGRNQFRLAAAD